MKERKSSVRAIDPFLFAHLLDDQVPRGREHPIGRSVADRRNRPTESHSDIFTPERIANGDGVSPAFCHLFHRSSMVQILCTYKMPETDAYKFSVRPI